MKAVQQRRAGLAIGAWQIMEYTSNDESTLDLQHSVSKLLEPLVI